MIIAVFSFPSFFGALYRLPFEAIKPIILFQFLYSMLRLFVLKATLVYTLFSVTYGMNGQIRLPDNPESTGTPVAKPYKILTNGKQITIQSKHDIRSVMVWTSSGHRIIEQKEINAASYKFTISVNERVFFMMLETVDGKRFTEKIGVQ